MLGLVYKGALFDESIKLHSVEDEEDNFDIMMDTAGKIYILKPIIRPQILDKMMGEILSQCEGVLAQTLNAFYPIKKETKTIKGPGENKVKPAAPAPTWLQKWAGETFDGDDDNTSKASELDPTQNGLTQNDEAAGDASVQVKPVKRRLKRTVSDFDKATNTHIARNHQRACLALSYVRLRHFITSYVLENCFRLIPNPDLILEQI